MGENTVASGIYFNVERDGKGFIVAESDVSGCKPGAKKWLACFAGLDGIV